jgi:hypothetical protein
VPAITGSNARRKKADWRAKARALRLQRLEVSDWEDSFAAIIRCTADPAKADERTRSKWSRVMRYVAAHKPHSGPLEQFVRRKGGINACASRFSRWLGRGAASKTVRTNAAVRLNCCFRWTHVHHRDLRARM